MASVVWKDKKPVLLLSTHAIPIGYPCMSVPTIPRKIGIEREDIMTSPMHLEYITHMLVWTSQTSYMHPIVHKIAQDFLFTLKPNQPKKSPQPSWRERNPYHTCTIES
jgi:hypothetical protein